jgi:hypothetical protein
MQIQSCLPVLAALALSGCSARLMVTKVDAPVNAQPGTGLDGVVYALPRTVVKADIPVERADQKPGTHAEFADLFFPERTAVKPGAPKVAFRVKRPVFSTFGEPDPDHTYIVKAGGKGAIEQSLLFEFTEQGAVTGIEASVDNQTTDLLLAMTSAATGMITRFGAAGPGKCPAPPGAPAEDAFVCFLKHAELVANYHAMEASRRKELVALFEDATGGRSRLTAAHMAYSEIRTYMEDTRNAREKMNDSLARRKAIDFVVKERDLLADKMIADEFTGHRKTSEWTGVFEMRPPRTSNFVTDVYQANGDLHSATLMTLLPQKGICTLADLRGKEPPPVAFKAAECREDDGALSIVRVRFQLADRDQLVSRVATRYRQPDKPGLRFAIPAQVKAELMQCAPAKSCPGTAVEKPVGESRMMVSQFGSVMAVPESLGGKMVAYNMKFFEATGALKSYKLTSKPMLTKGVVDSLSSNVNAIVDDKRNDRLTQMQRQRQLLEEQQKIRKLCEELHVADCEVR